MTMFGDILIGIQRIDTTQETTPRYMEYGGLVDISQRFTHLVKSYIKDGVDLVLIPTDYYKRETDTAAYIVGFANKSVYKVMIYKQKSTEDCDVFTKEPIKKSVSKEEFAELFYTLSCALTHSFTPTAFSTLPNKKECNCSHDHDHHCNCNHDYDKPQDRLVPSPVMDEERKKYLRERNDKKEPKYQYALMKGIPNLIGDSRGIISKPITDKNEIAAIMEEDAENDSKFRPKFLR